MREGGSLPTGALGRAFGSTAAAYKFFWLLALLRLAPHASRFAVRDVLIEMVLIAWTPAALYRLSFGQQDRLQDLIRDLQAAAHLPTNTSEARVRRALVAWPEARARLEPLGRYVPSRFLAPWHADGMPPSLRDDQRNRALAERSQTRSGGPLAGPYTIHGAGAAVEILLEPAWRDHILENLLVLRGFAELELARFLQARNPHVPGIVDKLRPAGPRNLVAARRGFEHLRGGPGLFDLYTGQPLGERYAVDHFLPRAFVAHDLLWNLAPASELNNRAKADQLPAPDFLPRLSALHYQLLPHAALNHSDLADYAVAFGADARLLREASPEAFAERHAALLTPLLQIAENQGFRAGWRPTAG